MPRKENKEAIRAFWQAHVDELDEGYVSDRLMVKAYDCGSVVTDYWDRVGDLDQQCINDAPQDFLEGLSEDQLLGCIAWHFRADHFDNYHFHSRETVLALQRIARAWLSRAAENAAADVQSIVYTIKACELALEDAIDNRTTISIGRSGLSKISRCLVSRRTGRTVKGTTENKLVYLPGSALTPLLKEVDENESLAPGCMIDLPILDAVSYVRLEPGKGKAVRSELIPYDEGIERFLDLLHKAIRSIEAEEDEEEI